MTPLAHRGVRVAEMRVVAPMRSGSGFTGGKLAVMHGACGCEWAGGPDAEFDIELLIRTRHLSVDEDVLAIELHGAILRRSIHLIQVVAEHGADAPHWNARTNG